MADGLPALGIVAAVLGVIKTMSHIDQPPAILGAMIGGALTGTFLGVLLAYGMVGPLSSRLQGVVLDEAKYMEVIRAVIVTHLHGNAPQVSIELGRKMVPNEHMPSFAEMEAAIEQVKVWSAPASASARERSSPACDHFADRLPRRATRDRLARQTERADQRRQQLPIRSPAADRRGIDRLPHLNRTGRSDRARAR